MPRKTMIESIRDAMDAMMGRDDNSSCSARTWAISVECFAPLIWELRHPAGGLLRQPDQRSEIIAEKG